MIKFKRMEIRNFLSWKKLDISFEKRGLVYVFGKNGNGKSGIATALRWCLYGKTGRDVKSDSVINSVMASDCRISVWFKSSGNNYDVTRARKHSKLGDGLRLRCNGKNLTCATIPETQRRVERIIGFDRLGFGNTVLFDPNSEELFSQGTDATQKSILKGLLRLSVFDKCKKVAAQREKRINLELAEAQERMRGYFDRSEDASARYAGIIDMRNKVKEKKASQLRKYKSTLLESRNKRGRLETSLHSAEVYQVKQEEVLNNCKTDLRVLEVENKKIVTMWNTGKCPTCDQKIIPKNFNAQKITVSENLSTAKKTLSRCRTKLQWATEKVTELGLRVYKIDNKCMRLQTLIVEEEAPIEDFKGLLAKGRKEINDLTDKIKGLKEEITELAGLHAQLLFWVKGFGTYGIERFAIAEVLPMLNQRIKTYLDQMPTANGVIEYVLGFDDNGRLSVCVSLEGRAGGYTQLSMGERRRVDVACQLALHDLIGSEINLLIIDELLTNMDDDAVDAAMGVFHNLKKESMFVISHDARLREQFTNVMEIARDKRGFSVIR